MSMICASGAIRFITPWHVPDEVVLEPEVAQERDEHAAERNAEESREARAEPDGRDAQ